jgi:glucosamine-phosphate N-acetyltransferase
MRIRTATSEDFNRICELLQQLWPDKKIDRGALKVVMNRVLSSSNDIYLCAETEQGLMGFCSLAVKNSLWQESRIGTISEMVVDDAYRKRGVGTALLGTIIEMARQRGCRLIELDSAFHRDAAHRFYEKAGFVKRAYLFSKEL